MDHPGLFTAGGETAAPAEFLAAIQKVLEARTLCFCLQPRLHLCPAAFRKDPGT
jgi:hypothetical protein